MLIRLLATTMSPVGLIFFNSMLALLEFSCPLITYLFLLNDPLKNENKEFFGILFYLLDFQLNVLIEYQKP
jgi:hypothetical protein